MGTYPREDRVEGVRATLRLPKHIVPFAVVSLGYPVDPPAAASRFDPTRVYHDHYEEDA